MSVSLTSGGGNYTTILTRTVAKAHLRVDGTDEDTLIDNLINAAGERAEDVTKKQLFTATRVLRMEGFHDKRYRRPDSPDILIPFPPLQNTSNLAISYLDTNGDSQTWSTSEWSVDANSVVGRIRPAYGYDYPSTREGVFDSVSITFDCGYGTNVTNIPTSIRQGMLLQIGAHYKFREDIIAGLSIAKLPDNYTSLSLWTQESVLELV